jgi:hypothetical protein
MLALSFGSQVACCAAGVACVPADDPNSLKALYRRGQAYAALHSYQEAARDLTAAAELSNNDPPQLQLIKEKLAAVQEKLGSQSEPVQQAQVQESQQQRQQQQEQESVQPQAAPKQDTAKQQHQQPETQEQQQQQQPKQQADVQQTAGGKAASSTQPTKQQASAPRVSTEEEDGLIEEIIDDRQPKAGVSVQAEEMDLEDVIGGSAVRSATSASRRAAAAAGSNRAAATSSGSAAAPPAAGFGGMPGDMQQMQQMAEMMRSNPGMMRQVGPCHGTGHMCGTIF